MVLPADLDTGAPVVYLSLEWALENGLLTFKDLAQARRAGLYVSERVHVGKTSAVYMIPLQIALIGDEAECESAAVWCELVEEWAQSGFASLNHHRNALVGRAPLLQLGVTLALDAEMKVTWVMPRGREEPETGDSSLIDLAVHAIQEVRELEPGGKSATRYQALVSQVLHGLFYPDLDEPNTELKNKIGTSRYDVTFINRAKSGFWHHIKLSRDNPIVIFDAKNKTALRPSDVDQMLRYSSPWRGMVIFIVCRQRPGAAITRRLAYTLAEKDVCIIVLSDDDLQQMVALKSRGESPERVVERLYRERIEGT